MSLGAKTVLFKPSEELVAWIETRMKGVIIYDEAMEGKPVVEVQLDRTRGIDPGFTPDNLLNEDIARLRILDQLHSLSLDSRPGINDSVFESLAKLRELRTVNLSSTRIPSFYRLSLYECRITGAALDTIGTMTQLQRLDMYATTVDGGLVNDGHVASLINLRLLTWLNLNDTRVSDEAMKTIESFSQLRDLFLDRTQVTDEGVYPVSRWPRIQRIMAVGTSVTGRASLPASRIIETRESRQGLSFK